MLKTIVEYMYGYLLRYKYSKVCGVFKIINSKVPLSCEFEIDKNSDCMIDGLLVRAGCAIRVRQNAKIKISNGVAFNNNCILTCRNKIEIGEKTNIGPNCCIFDHDHDYISHDRLASFKEGPILIGKNVWIGANVTILRGTNIGNNCVIGAGSVVRGKFNDNCVIAGNPATVKKQF